MKEIQRIDKASALKKAQASKKRDPGAVNPRGAASGPTQQMRDKAARERNAARITRPVQARPGSGSAPGPQSRPNNPTRRMVKPKSNKTPKNKPLNWKGIKGLASAAKNDPKKAVRVAGKKLVHDAKKNPLGVAKNVGGKALGVAKGLRNAANKGIKGGPSQSPGGSIAKGQTVSKSAL